MPIAVGSEAPLFELPLRPGEAPLRIADYRGQKSVVLLFFPLSFSGVCTTQMRTIADDYSRWGELGAEVIGISVDSVWVCREFAEACGARFPILSDFNKDVSSAYGVLNDDFLGMRGVANRSAFVIDPEGIITYSWTSEDAEVLPDLDAIRVVLAA